MRPLLYDYLLLPGPLPLNRGYCLSVPPYHNMSFFLFFFVPSWLCFTPPALLSFLA